MKKAIVLGLLLFLLMAPIRSQDQESGLHNILEEIFPIPSLTGYEGPMVSAIQGLLPAGGLSKQDSFGSLYVTVGDGADSFALLTGIDEVGYIVSGFDSAGYLWLDRVVTAASPLYDSFHFGHPMTIWTEEGPVAGVLSLPSLHIVSREMRSDLQNVFSLENARVDIGVRSEEEARSRGIRMLDPVLPIARISHLARDQIAGSSLSVKLCTALLVEIAGRRLQSSSGKKNTFVWAVQTQFPARGSRPRAALGAALAQKYLSGIPVLLIGTYPLNDQDSSPVRMGAGPVLVSPEGVEDVFRDQIRTSALQSGTSLQVVENFNSQILAPFIEGKRAMALLLPVKYPSSPNEKIDFKDALSLEKLLLALLQ